MSWRVAYSLKVIKDQIDEMWPNRSTRSDGTIGNLSHQSRVSDHNPNAQGVVTARDITHDPANGADMEILFHRLLESHDPRIKYCIWNRQMFSSYSNSSRKAWTIAPYAHADTMPHTGHLHLSVVGDRALYDSNRRWDIMPFTPEQEAFLAQFAQTGLDQGSNGPGMANAILKLWRTLRGIFTN